MEITLEKIELVKDRTGVTYKVAKEALEATNGSVVDAIINIEENMQTMSGEEKDSENFDVFSKVKETINKGNVSRIMVKKGDETILNLPLSAGVLGAIIAPWGVIFGAIAVAGFNCRVEFINDKGEITDINGKVKDQYDKALQSSHDTFEKINEKIKDSDIYNTAVEKGTETFDKIKDSDMYADMKQKSQEAYEVLKEKSMEMRENIKKSQEDDEEIRKTAEESFSDVTDSANDLFKYDVSARTEEEATLVTETDEADIFKKSMDDIEELNKVLDEVERDSSLFKDDINE